MSLRIAIVKLGALGDVVRTTVLLKSLQAQHPGAEISWFTSQAAEPLLKRNPLIHAIIPVETMNPSSPPGKPFDLVFGLDEDLQACRLATRLKDSRLIGAYEDEHGQLRYTDDSRAWFEMGLLNRDPDGSLKTANALKRRNKRSYPEFLLDMAEISPAFRRKVRPVVIPDAEAEIWARQWAETRGLKPGKGIFGLNTGAGRRWPSKQMSLPKTVELVTALRKLGVRILLLGGREETDRNHQLKLELGDAVIDTGTENSLIRFISLINLCEVLITSDSLALHLGTALGKKIVAFFGPTAAAEIDLGDQGFKWLPRSPCECFYASSCRRSAFCLDTLDIGRVTRAASVWLAEPRERA